MRRSKGGRKPVQDDASDHDDAAGSYFTYRPLSNLPTPPPMTRETRMTPCQSPPFDDYGCALPAIYRGPAIHLVNLIPSTASLATASVHIAQSMLAKANLPLETVALAVCILDSLGPIFARKWRLTCPLRSETCTSTHADDDEAAAASAQLLSPSSKRHSLPATPSIDQGRQLFEPQLHIDSVSPELIVLAALVIAEKFTEDDEQPSQHYCASWGGSRWTAAQLNATERSIMEALNYRIMPLCAEDCLADAMADMQLAGEQLCAWDIGEPSPPDSVHGEDESPFIPGHARSKTMAPTTNRSSSVGLGLSWATAM
ncbi:hypothetical protein K4F52_003531 [Lecanicillium sp. MT-2017a]|nr:hypothetical protein K4F52_003531 [Lecanicillium sp. MT-2017a]